MPVIKVFGSDQMRGQDMSLPRVSETRGALLPAPGAQNGRKAASPQREVGVWFSAILSLLPFTSPLFLCFFQRPHQQDYIKERLSRARSRVKGLNARTWQEDA